MMKLGCAGVMAAIAVLSGCQAEVKVQPLPPPPPVYTPPPPPAAPVTINDRVEFDSASPLLRDQDKPMLDRIAKLLKDNAHVRLVELQAHTDDGGEKDPNLLLSEARGEVVRGYLINQGVEAARMRVHAFGTTVPIDNNNTPEGRQHNRRVEFRVIQQ